jgi:hypothetical protein
MNRSIEDGEALYATAQEAGQRVICERRAALLDGTKAALVESGFYSGRGERLESGGITGTTLQDNCERLEHALGVMKQCVASKLPDRAEKGAPIPREAADDEVLSSCEVLLYARAWHGPAFLRLGLAAVVVHQQANALSMIGPPLVVSAPLGCLGGFSGSDCSC